MAITNTPNMTLPIPGVGTEPGPDYATDVNNSLEIIDRHDHTPGSGVMITPSAININAALTFAGNFATNVAGVTLAPQIAIPAPDTVYVNDVDLYFRDGDGNVIQLTTNGGVSGTPGSITNLVAPASATYVAVNSTFVWQSGVNIAANLDAGSILLRNLTPNSTYALTLSPPAAMGADYTLTLPSLPLSTSFLTIDTSGNIDGSVSTTLGITASMLATDSVTNSKIQDDAVTTAKVLNGAITPAKLSFVPAVAATVVSFTSSGTQVMPTGATYCTVVAWGGGGGGGGGGASASAPGGGGGASGAYAIETFAVVPGETVNVTVGGGGAGGAATLPGTIGNGTQVDSTVTGWILFAPGGGLGLAAGGAGGDQGQGAGFTYGVGGNGGAAGSAGGAGKRSSHAAAQPGMNPVLPHGGGGAGSSGRLIAGTQVAGNNGADAAANSAAGGGGGAGGLSGQAGGNGGSGHVTLIFNSTT